MTKLDWSKQAERDPARVVDIGSVEVLSDKVSARVKRAFAAREAQQRNLPRSPLAALPGRAKSTTLAKRIDIVSRSGRVDANDFIHETALLTLAQVQKYGDASSAARLVDAMPKSRRRSQLIRWFAAFSPISIGRDRSADKMKAYLAGKPTDRVWNSDEAAVTPFYTMQ